MKRDECWIESHEACLAINFFPSYRPFPIIFLGLMIFKEAKEQDEVKQVIGKLLFLSRDVIKCDSKEFKDA